MTHHIYSKSALRRDYMRSFAGLALTGAPLVLAPFNALVTTIFAALAGLFAYYGLRTLMRARLTVTVDDQAIVMQGRRRAIAWRDLDALRLAYFPSRRDRSEGLMELSMGGGGVRIKIDSQLEGFAEIAQRAYDNAEQKGLILTRPTMANFSSLGAVLALGGTGAGNWGRPADWHKKPR